MRSISRASWAADTRAFGASALATIVVATAIGLAVSPIEFESIGDALRAKQVTLDVVFGLTLATTVLTLWLWRRLTASRPRRLVNLPGVAGFVSFCVAGSVANDGQFGWYVLAGPTSSGSFVLFPAAVASLAIVGAAFAVVVGPLLDIVPAAYAARRRKRTVEATAD